MSPNQQRVKAVWKNIGKEPQFKEYGYGTGRAIPAQIWAQAQNPESHWEFVYVQESDNVVAKYMSTPVWFYDLETTNEAGEKSTETYFTLSSSDIPDDATDAFEGHVYDAYRLNATKKDKPSKPIAPKDLQARRLKELDKLAEIMSAQGLKAELSPNGGITFVKTDNVEEGSLLPLYLQALSTGNGSLVVDLKNFAESGRKSLTMSIYDFLGVKGGDEARHLLENDPQPYLDAFLKAQTKQMLDAVLINISHDANHRTAEQVPELEWERIDPSAVPSALQELAEDLKEEEDVTGEPPKKKRGRPKKAVQEAAQEADEMEADESFMAVPSTPSRIVSTFLENIVVNTSLTEVAPFDPHAGATGMRRERRAPVDVKPPAPEVVKEQREFSFAMPQITTKHLTRGAGFIHSVPAEALMGAFNQLDPFDKKALLASLPGVFTVVDGQIQVVAPNRRSSSTENMVMSASRQRALALTLEKFVGHLDKLNPRLLVSGDVQEYSPLFLDNLPLRTKLSGAQIANLVANTQAAFRLSMIKTLKQRDSENFASTIESLMEGKGLDLSKVPAQYISEALNRAGRFMYEADEEGELTLTDFGKSVKSAAETAGVSDAEILDTLRQTFVDNIAVRVRSNASSYSKASQKNSLGMMVGLLIGAVRGAMKASAKPKGSASNGHMHLVHEQMNDIAEEVMGGRAFMSSDDVMTYTMLDGNEIQLSTSMWQTLHFALPYYYDQNKNLIVEINGDTTNFTALSSTEKEQYRDALMSYIASQTNPKTMSAFEGDKLQYFLAKKYQDALLSDPVMGSVLSDYNGDNRADIQQLDQKDSVVHEPSLEAASAALNSISNYLLSDIANMMQDPGLIPSEFKYADSHKEAIRAVLRSRLDKTTMYTNQLVNEMGISSDNSQNAQRIIGEAIAAFIDDFVENKLTEELEGKHITKAGYSIENLAMVAPILGMMADPRYKDAKFDFSSEGENLLHDIPMDSLVKGPLKKTDYNFFDSSISPKGFQFRVNGQEHHVFTDTNQTNGAGDIMHVADPPSGRQFHSYESKLGKSTPERPHLSYVSRNLRNAMLFGRGTSIKMGGYRTLNLRYDSGEGRTPVSTPPHVRKYGNVKMNLYGLSMDGNALNANKFSEYLSTNDGLGLAGVRSL